MEKLKERIETFRNALKTVEEILAEQNSKIVRDAAIQRFEYTVETMWKVLKLFLLDAEGVEVQTPKSCIRSAMQAGVLNPTDTEIALEMINDRNLTSHTYIEEIATSIYRKLPKYAHLMNQILLYLDQRVKL